MVLSESQHSKLFLKEEELSLYKDKNFDMEVNGFDKNTGSIVLKPGKDEEINCNLGA
jgi:hypothetical protein